VWYVTQTETGSHQPDRANPASSGSAVLEYPLPDEPPQDAAPSPGSEYWLP
jgi:hypothetical protein